MLHHPCRWSVCPDWRHWGSCIVVHQLLGVMVMSVSVPGGGCSWLLSTVRMPSHSVSGTTSPSSSMMKVFWEPGSLLHSRDVLYGWQWMRGIFRHSSTLKCSPLRVGQPGPQHFPPYQQNSAGKLGVACPKCGLVDPNLTVLRKLHKHQLGLTSKWLRKGLDSLALIFPLSSCGKWMRTHSPTSGAFHLLCHSSSCTFPESSVCWLLPAAIQMATTTYS